MRIALILFFFLPSLSQATPVAVLNLEKLPQSGQTSIWSPLFQASWDQLKQNHAGKLIKIEPPNPLIMKLETFQWEKDKVMPPDGYAIYAGLNTPEFAKATAADVKKRFHFDMDTTSLPQTGRGMAYYGVLMRDLTFQKTFFRSRKTSLLFSDGKGKSHRVSFFGTAGGNSGAYGKNVKIIEYSPKKKSFVLSINTDKPSENIIIYRPENPSSFHTAIQHIQSALQNPLQGRWGAVDYTFLHENDIVKIPHLKIHTTTSLTTLLKGHRFYENESDPSFIARAYQITDFELSETGAKIRLQTGTADAFGGASIPRNFTCDSPFFVFAWRDEASHPYFAAWIDGPDALQPFQKQ